MSANSTEIPADPSDVHPEHDELTPQNEDDWTEAQIERYTAAKEAQLHQEGNKRKQEQARQEQEALDALESAVGYDEETADELTEDIELDSGTTVTVTKRMTGEVENAIERIQQSANTEDIGTGRDALIEGITCLIVDDDESGRYSFTDREVWEAWHERHGLEGLMDVFLVLSEPAVERQENLDKFRGDDHRHNTR